MQNRIVEVVSEKTHLSIHRGFLSVTVNGAEAGRIVIADIGALIVRGHGASLSVNVCTRLAEAKVPIVLCGAKQSPASIIWPVAGHFSQGLHMQAQAVANKPLLKRLWGQLVRSKIQAQSEVLCAFNEESADLRTMAGRVRNGDPENLEAQAARRYWPRLMGKGFHRDRSSNGVNAALNYGYTVLRAATARSVLAAGLHPSLSINHQSRGDPLRLADDLMEPFRPWMDHRVRLICVHDRKEMQSFGPEEKAQLASVLQLDFQSQQGTSPMQVCIDRMAQSLSQVFLRELRKMEIPGQPVHLASGVPEPA